MKEGAEFDLLSDVAKLLKKHGPDAFEKLARLVSAPESSERLGAILAAAAKTARAAQNGCECPPRSAGRGIRASLAEIAHAEPEKSQILSALYEDLRAGRVLPTLGDFRAFAVSNGLPPIQAPKRTKAVDYLIEALVPLDRDRVKAIAGRLKPDVVQDDRSLAGWTRIILDQERRQKEPHP